MSANSSAVGRIATRHAMAIVFIAVVLCLGGVYCALTTPSSVFPRTDFPRVVILVNNGIMPADEMMATITRPIEEAVKAIPGVTTVSSSTGRGSAQINVSFNWSVDMIQSEQYVLGRLGEIKSDLPATASTDVERVTFSAYPIIGVSVTSATRDLMSLWEAGQYTIKPRLLQISGVASIDLMGGHAPEYHVVVDPRRLDAAQLSIQDVSDALTKNNLVAAAGTLEQNYHLYLMTVDGRAHDVNDLRNIVIVSRNGHPVHIADVAQVLRRPEPGLTDVTAQGRNAVLLNIMSQPQGSTLKIADAVQQQLKQLRKDLPPDIKLDFFYDQSSFVRDSVGSVWEAILFGLALSIVILYLFLKSWGTVMTAIFVIPITVLVTFISMKLLGMTFNMMTLGGIAAAIGLVIDDAIVVVESIFAKVAAGHSRTQGIQEGLGEILHALVGSTLTPVVVFIPLAFLVGITGVFFRALALTMVVSLLTSLVLAVTVTPSLAAWFIRERKPGDRPAEGHEHEGGPILRRVMKIYERSVRGALAHRWLVLLGCLVIGLFGFLIFRRLETEFLPSFDEGGFVIDFNAPAGTSLSETSRLLMQAEAKIKADPDVEGYSRRLGAQLGLFITEPYRGDYLVKLKHNHKRATEDIIADFRHTLKDEIPAVEWDLHGILTDLVGDLVMTPDPIEVKLFSQDLDWLRKEAAHVEDTIKTVPGVVDTFNGLTETGPSFKLSVRPADAARYGLTTSDIATALNTEILGMQASTVLDGDRIVNVRVIGAHQTLRDTDELAHTLIRTPSGAKVQVRQVADIGEQGSEVELDREDLRQNVIVTGRLEGRDLGSAMQEIKAKLAKDPTLPPGTVEYGGLYQQQQESFFNLLMVLLMALLLVFTVLLIEFRSFFEPVAIIFGSILALVGTVAALWVTGTSLNVVAFLGAIIGVGLVAKNGILMLDRVDHLRAEGLSLEEAIVRSGDRRLRPVLMTTLAAAIGMGPLAWGIGTGAQMLQPLAIAVIGALCISVLLSLVGTPTVYYILLRLFRRAPAGGAHPRSAAGRSE